MTPTLEIIWVFSRLEGRASAHFTLEKNFQFYLDLPANEGAFGLAFGLDSTKRFPFLRQASVIRHFSFPVLAGFSRFPGLEKLGDRKLGPHYRQTSNLLQIY